MVVVFTDVFFALAAQALTAFEGEVEEDDAREGAEENQQVFRQGQLSGLEASPADVGHDGQVDEKHHGERGRFFESSGHGQEGLCGGSAPTGSSETIW